MKIIKDFCFFLKNKESFLEFKSNKYCLEEQIEKIYYAITKEKYCNRMDFGWFCNDLVELIKENNVNVIVELKKVQVELKKVQEDLLYEEKVFEKQESDMHFLEQEITSLKNENRILKEKRNAYLNLESYTKN